MERNVYRLKAGSFSNLTLLEEELPSPKPNEVTVAVRAIGLNFADLFALWGLYSATPKGEFIPGLEYAGEIIRIGEAVTDRKVGDRVMGITRFGAYASHLNIESAYVFSLPEDWDYPTGAAYLVQGLTAYYALTDLGNLQEDACVLIHSAAGGVGTLANRFAKTKNAYTIGTVGSAAKVDYCKQEGYDQVIVRGKDFKERLVEALDGRPLDLILECIGGKILQIGFDHLGPQGRMVVYGAAQYASSGDRPNYLQVLWKFFTRPKIDPQQLTQTNRGILGFNLIYLYEQIELGYRLLKEMEQLHISPPYVGHTFTFEELPEAVRLFRTGKTMGKVVVVV
jgi:NADPH:quinone reductase-like Zn-dependent oxidoreductase